MTRPGLIANLFAVVTMSQTLAMAQGTETVLHSFTGGNGGQSPETGVVLDSSGNPYGAAAGGGRDKAGVVYMLDPAGNQTVLYNFTGGADGDGPVGNLARDSADNLYGVTYGGGAYNAGVVFELDTYGNETVLYAFTGGDDGWHPFAGPFRDKRGSMCGTTAGGGKKGVGVVYKVKP